MRFSTADRSLLQPGLLALFQQGLLAPGCQRPHCFFPTTIANTQGSPKQVTSNFTLTTASLPAHHPNTFISRPSPVLTSLRRQIINDNYIDLALLILPCLHQPPADRFIEGYEGCPHYKVRAPSRSRELTPTEFAYTFSLYRDVLCSKFSTRRNELDNYLSIILNLALCFGSNGFYRYHTHFTSEAAARISQFNEATY